MALATKIISASVASCLKEFTAQSTKRQFAAVYPFLGTIWSMLGEKNFGPGVRPRKLNSMPVTSQRPVHLAAAHSGVRENSNPFFAARPQAAFNRCAHGV